MAKRISWCAKRGPASTAIALAMFAQLLAACGGGGDDLVPLRAAPAVQASVRLAEAATRLTLRLQGCVVDEYSLPRSDTPVRALAPDGRLLGNAQSDMNGVFKVQLPAGQTVAMAVDRLGGEVIKVASGDRSRTLTICLIDPHN